MHTPFPDDQACFDYLQETANVSRETFSKMQQYVELLYKWNQQINLVSAKTIPQIWQRHVMDSVQLFPYIATEKTVLDIGTGGGLPGILLAILGVREVHMVESDRKKCLFLSEVMRLTEIKAQVHNSRIEALVPWRVDVITARAFAPLKKILKLSQAFVGPETEYFLLKGELIEEEIAEARKEWDFSYSKIPSITHDKGCIVRLTLNA